MHLFEEASELADVGAAVSLWPNALAALGRIGLEGAVRAQGQWEEDGALRKPSGAAFWRSRNSNLIILRPALQQVLLDAGRDLLLTLGARCTDLTSPSDSPTVILNYGSAHEFDVVIGADGVRSSVRASIAPGDSPPLHSGGRHGVLSCRRRGWSPLPG